MIIKNITLFVCGNIFSICGYIGYKGYSTKKLNIVFDLDETIIHTDKKDNVSNYNGSNISKQDLIEISDRNIWIRPYVKMLLPVLSKFNNIYLFTKATKPYTDEILEKIKLDKYFKEKKYRDDCKGKGICKDLTKFKLDVNKSILIDDKLSNKCAEQNFYHIPRFNYYVKNDFEFVKLFGYILWLNISNDFGIKN